MIALASATLWSALWANVGIAVALVIVIGLAERRVRSLAGANWGWMLGLMFGATGIAVMQSPFPVRHGVLIDVRDVVVVIAGATSGVMSGLVAGALVAAYRLSLGGAGTLGGTGAIVSTTVLGIVWYLRRPRDRVAMPAFELLVLGLVLAVVFLPWGLALPESVRWASIRRSAGPVFVLFPLGTLLIGALLGVERSRAQAMGELTLSEERFRRGFALSPAGIAALDAQGRLRQVNAAFARMLGRSEQELVGMSIAELTHPDEVGAAEDAVRGLASGELETYRTEKRYVRADGSTIWAAVSSTSLPSGPGRPWAMFSIVEDLTQRKKLEARLRELATTDELTGLPNRKELTRRLDEALARAKRTRRHVAALFVDLDRFKQVNDNLGHAVGDQLLRSVSERLRATVRPTDVVSRVGGDEFVIGLEELEHPREAVEIAQRVLAAVSIACEIDGHELNETASIGLAHARGDTPAAILIQHADIAMYRAKSRGRGQLEVFDDRLSRESRRRYAIEQALARAVERDELRLLYQPIVSLHTGRVTAVEALLRWEHPQGTLIQPSEFIPIAEETGRIRDLGTWVAHEACRQAAAWEQLGIEPIPVHINVSALEVREPAFVADLEAALRAAGVGPHRLCVEITESVLMDIGNSIERLCEIAALGVGIAIDDFGTGYSSLAYMQSLPADVLKVDRSLIAEVTGDASGLIAEMTVALAAAVNVTLIAEGIEDAEQAEQLRELGYHRAQGFHFGRPQTGTGLGPSLPHRLDGGGDRDVREPPLASYQIHCALQEHPAVYEAASICVTLDGDSEPGVMSFIQLQPRSEVAVDTLAAWCEEWLPAFVVPRYYTLVDQLPKLGSPRTSARALRELSQRLPTWDRLSGTVRGGRE